MVQKAGIIFEDTPAGICGLCPMLCAGSSAQETELPFPLPAHPQNLLPGIGAPSGADFGGAGERRGKVPLWKQNSAALVEW